MSIKNKYDFNGNLVYFLIWPIFGLIYACSRIEFKGARFIIVLFAMVFGFSFIIPDKISDANAYRDLFKEMSKRDFSDYIIYIFDIFDKNADYTSEVADLFLPTLYFVLSRFTTSTELLFLMFSLIFSVFIVLNFKYLINVYNKFPNINSKVYLIFIAFLIPIFHINHFRWYMGFMTFLLATYGLLTKNDKRYFILCLFSGLIHFSFFIFIIIITIFYFLPNYKKAYYFILILSFLFSGIFSDYANTFGDNLSGSVQQRALSYSDDYYKDLIKENNESGLFILLQYQTFCKFTLLSILIFLDYKKYIKSEILNKLFLFSILVYSITNFGNDIHSFSSRFLLLFQVVACLTLIQIFSEYKIEKMHLTSYFGLIALLILSIVQIRYGMPYTSINVLLPFFGTSFIMDNTTSILDIIK